MYQHSLTLEQVTWAQLFEGRLALSPGGLGLNLTQR